MRPAVFLDKDGTLITNVPYNVDPERLEFAPGAVESLRTLQRAGFRIVLVSNQSGVGRGLFTCGDVEVIGGELSSRLKTHGVVLDGFYYCPHQPLDGCACRKPRPGLLLQASADLDLHLERSWLIGDILDDVEAGRRAGCRAILLDNGGETEWRGGDFRRPYAIVANLAEAAHVILHAPVRSTL